MASNSFRDSINNLGWARREPDIPVNTSQQSGLLSSIKSLNPFGQGGYVRLPTTESAGAPLPAPSRREEEEGWFVRESPRCPALFPYEESLSALHDPSLPLPTEEAAGMCRGCAPSPVSAMGTWHALPTFPSCSLFLLGHDDVEMWLTISSPRSE
jgi:hypothetical protein